jgi:aminoglycoside phosphotransferase (APT) family kinase protein
LDWLANPEQLAGVLDARCAADPLASAVLPAPMRTSVADGWTAALKRLPPRVVQMMNAPASEIASLWDGLPRTLLHGDTKVANFALMPDTRVAAFDWAWIGAGPATVDVGWYLAVNASRLARTKEATLQRYRSLLSSHLDASLPDELWETLVRAGVLVGARMLLWSKALAAEAGRSGAEAEWAWWAERLDAACE